MGKTCHHVSPVTRLVARASKAHGHLTPTFRTGSKRFASIPRSCARTPDYGQPLQSLAPPRGTAPVSRGQSTFGNAAKLLHCFGRQAERCEAFHYGPVLTPRNSSTIAL